MLARSLRHGVRQLQVCIRSSQPCVAQSGWMHTAPPLRSGIRPASRAWDVTPAGHSSTALRRHASLPLNKRTSRCFSSGGGAGGNAGSGGGGGGGGDDGQGKGNFFWSLWLAYLHLIDKHPLLTKSISAGILNGLGDIIAQVFVEGKEKLDLKRLAVFSAVGLFWIGPLLDWWYAYLTVLVPGVGTAVTIGRVVVDQFVFGPLFITSIISILMTLEGHKDGIKAKLKADLLTILKTNWLLWIPFQFFNFRLVPLKLQVMAANVMALVWNVYMSIMSHK